MLEVEWLGGLPFDAALARQHEQRHRVVEGAPGRLFLVEHPACLTLGRRARAEDILWTPEELARRGVQVFETPRGGEATLHAPGQLVVYPVVRVGRQIRQHLHHLAEVTRSLLAELGVGEAVFRDDHPGLWVGDAKLASMGIHVARGVAVQGLSLNLAVDRALFGALVSCGLRGVTLLSAQDCGAVPVTVAAAATRWAELWAQATGVTLQWIRRPEV